jgi:hypothetical protein
MRRSIQPLGHSSDHLHNILGVEALLAHSSFPAVAHSSLLAAARDFAARMLLAEDRIRRLDFVPEHIGAPANCSEVGSSLDTRDSQGRHLCGLVLVEQESMRQAGPLEAYTGCLP